MAWFMTVAEETGPMCHWVDKRGEFVGPLAPPQARVGSLPFYKWAADPKVTDLANIPTLAIQEDKRKPTDVFWIGDASVVSERFKNVIEECEPGVHQFFPFVLQQKNGVPHEARFFIFHPARYATCVLLSKMEGVEKATNIDGIPYYSFQDNAYVISRPAYGDRKFFGAMFLWATALMVTDDAMERIKKARIKYLRIHPVKELDEPWSLEKEAPEYAAYLRSVPEYAASRLKTY